MSYCKVNFRILLSPKSDYVSITKKFLLRPDIDDSNLVSLFAKYSKRPKKRVVQSFVFLTMPALLPLPPPPTPLPPKEEELNWAEYDVVQNVLVVEDLQ